MLLAKDIQSHPGQKMCQIWERSLWSNHSHQDQTEKLRLLENTHTKIQNAQHRNNPGVSVFVIHLKFWGRGELGKDRTTREKHWTVKLRAIKSIRTEQPLRKMNFLAYKPSHCSSVLWICKCLCRLAAWEEGTASLSTQSLASAPESCNSALGVINLSNDMPLRRLSKAFSPKSCQALSRGGGGGSETEGSGKPTTYNTST